MVLSWNWQCSWTLTTGIDRQHLLLVYVTFAKTSSGLQMTHKSLLTLSFHCRAYEEPDTLKRAQTKKELFVWKTKKPQKRPKIWGFNVFLFQFPIETTIRRIWTNSPWKMSTSTDFQLSLNSGSSRKCYIRDDRKISLLIFERIN